MTVQELERTVNKTSEEAKNYRRELSTELVKLDAKIDAMAANIKQASVEVQAEYESRLRELQEQRHTVEQTLTELQQSGESALETLESGLETAWQDLVNTFQSMHDDFNHHAH